MRTQIGHHLGECDQEGAVTPCRITDCKHVGRDGSESTAPGNSSRITNILRWPATLCTAMEDVDSRCSGTRAVPLLPEVEIMIIFPYAIHLNSCALDRHPPLDLQQLLVIVNVDVGQHGRQLHSSVMGIQALHL